MRAAIRRIVAACAWLFAPLHAYDAAHHYDEETDD